ncbi:MAG: tRNA (adenosine(37)-N6)-threonylcarbamoyltransferase complex transferase subunit TsaD [Prevotellaceae bacterium]|jgi:N6-L-threonylcarbamoyladenine synthase|nr:tRNA (adenosine(37)-N6)-threonylcarbamoyltransferase complex transferase subunit TsaD [Prevotellaceae bacterium]
MVILGIESSCDDTSAAVVRDGVLLSNVLAGQEVHRQYGGVIPELASRAHQQHIIPVTHGALTVAGVRPGEVDAVAFTSGPGLMGSLLVGTSFAKGFSLATGAPLVAVNHLQGHVLSHFIDVPEKRLPHPSFPFLCLLVSGGHSQLIVVNSFLHFDVIGETIDDAAGEAFDKCAKVMGLPYPGGPIIDRLATQGNPQAFRFARPQAGGLDYSFSGLKTSFLYFLRDRMADNPAFIEEHRHDLCASLQHTIIEILMHNLVKAAAQTGIREIAVAGGVSANSGLRQRLLDEGKMRRWQVYLPELRFTTDNAAMIAITGYYLFLAGKRTAPDVTPTARIRH